MKKKFKLDPNSSEYQVALMEDMNHKFDAIMETVSPLVVLPAGVREIKDIVSEMQPRLDATFEAVGAMMVEITDIKRRVLAVEEKVNAR